MPSRALSSASAFARAVADTVAALHDDLENGGGISGPAARRAIKAAAAAPRFAGVLITLASARRLLANEDAMIYDNPNAPVLCHYKREKALCHRDGIRDTPSFDRCVPGGGNIARTDQQATQLRDRARALEADVPRNALTQRHVDLKNEFYQRIACALYGMRRNRALP